MNLGDTMKMNLFVSICCALLLGYLCTHFIFKQYNETIPTFSDFNNVYFLQYQVAILDNSSEMEVPYITVEDNGKYYVYVGITTDYQNAKKIKDFYSGMSTELYIKEEFVDNVEFVNELSQYDILLKSADEEQEVKSVLSTILSSYEEFVLKR